jgi:hypothetical protein
MLTFSSKIRTLVTNFLILKLRTRCSILLRLSTKKANNFKALSLFISFRIKRDFQFSLALVLLNYKFKLIQSTFLLFWDWWDLCIETAGGPYIPVTKITFWMSSMKFMPWAHPHSPSPMHPSPLLKLQRPAPPLISFIGGATRWTFIERLTRVRVGPW